MNKSDLIDAMAADAGISKVAAKAWKLLTETKPWLSKQIFFLKIGKTQAN